MKIRKLLVLLCTILFVVPKLSYAEFFSVDMALPMAVEAHQSLGAFPTPSDILANPLSLDQDFVNLVDNDINTFYQPDMGSNGGAIGSDLLMEFDFGPLPDIAIIEDITINIGVHISDNDAPFERGFSLAPFNCNDLSQFVEIDLGAPGTFAAFIISPNTPNFGFPGFQTLQAPLGTIVDFSLAPSSLILDTARNFCMAVFGINEEPETFDRPALINASLLYRIPDPVVTVTLQGTGTGGVISPTVGQVVSPEPGVECNSSGPMNCDEAFFLSANEMITLTATPDIDSLFTGWSGDDACLIDPMNPVLDLTMDMDISCIATFTLQTRTLTLNKLGNGDGTVTSMLPGIDCAPGCSSDMNDFDINSDVTLTAVADPDSIFTGWGGDCSGTDPTAVVNMADDRVCEATFILKTFTVNVEIVGSGDGSVTADPPTIECGVIGTDCDETYLIHTQVTLIAEPDPVSIFVGWSGDTDCEDGILQDLTVDTMCIATFVLIDLVLNPISPALDDNINFITAEQAYPAGNVAILWGKRAGNFSVSGQVCGGTILGINPPNILTIVRANDFGIATYIFYIPTFNDLQFEVQLQAIDIETCRTSNIVPQIIRKDESG